MSKGKMLRDYMKGGMVTAPFVNEGYGAKVAQSVGFKAIYMTGFGTAATYGIPDVGLLTYKEMVDKISHLTEACDLPIIADADTGYGNYSNVYRTVRGYERAGAAALHLEDQVWPERSRKSLPEFWRQTQKNTADMNRQVLLDWDSRRVWIMRP